MTPYLSPIKHYASRITFYVSAARHTVWRALVLWLLLMLLLTFAYWAPGGG